MKNNKSKPISLAFLVYIVGIVAIMLLYATSLPKDKNNIEEDVLIIRDITNSNHTALNYSNKVDDTKKIKINDKPKAQDYNLKNSGIEDYNKFLDSIKDVPPYSMDSVEKVVDKILEYKGYPAGLIDIETDIYKSNLNVEGSYLIAQFDIASGKMRISKEQLNNLDMKLIISVLAHELDHFEKAAQICKSMGEYEFGKLIQSYGIKNYDSVFWVRASYYANLDKFDSQMYKDALYRYLNQNMVEATSSYSDFYKLTENIRNPLEISAYKVSDYIQKYYGIPLTEGPMKSIARKFNEVDWSIYNIVQNNDILREERVALFDYFFAKAIIYRYPQYKKYYDVCINERDGDLTLFWLNFEKSMSDFYINGNLSTDTTKKIIGLLSDTKSETQRVISDEQYANALKYKVKTLLSNIVYRSAAANVRKTAVSYLKYIKSKNIYNPKTELDFIMTLICIENQISNLSEEQIKISDIKIPDELKEIYNITSKYGQYNFIYNNPEFINIKNKVVIKDEDLLLQLIRSNKIRIRKKD